MSRTMQGGWEYGLTPQTINNFRQNSPELIIRDARFKLGLNQTKCEILKEILLARGVNKWFKARRDVIKLKDRVRKRIKELSKTYNKHDPAHKAEMKTLVWLQGELRSICHQPRWVEWPDIADPSKAEKKLIIRGPHS